jgi:microcin C transport system ATP-binding protein
MNLLSHPFSILKVQNLSISESCSIKETGKGIEKEVKKEILGEISFEIFTNQIFAVTGETGAGKTLLGLSLVGLLNQTFKAKGNICFLNDLILKNNVYNEKKLKKIRGTHIGFVFQEPLSALNPLKTIFSQLKEALTLDGSYHETKIKSRIIELLELVSFSKAIHRIDAYPHMLSGGERQRILIALALANRPQLLIADEPTTALDLETRDKILNLFQRLKRETSILLMSHDISLIKQIADQTYTVSEGKMRQGLIEDSVSYKKNKLTSKNPVLIVQNLSIFSKPSFFHKFFLKPSIQPFYLRNISFTVKIGETLGIIGKTGAGKTSLAHGLLFLNAQEFRHTFQQTGNVFFYENNYENNDEKSKGSHKVHQLNALRNCELQKLRRFFQIVFQDPLTSFNPRFLIKDIVGEALDAHKKENQDKIYQMFDALELPHDLLYRFPHECSGGQRQRIAIIRSLIVRPRLLILDEVTSSLNNVIRKKTIDFLQKHQEKEGTAYIFISHDYKLINEISHNIIALKSSN